MSEADHAALLRIRGLHKSYAAPVLTDVAFDLRAGEVHALIGANGAGKSTLAKIVCGLVQPDRVSMEMGGQPYRPGSKSDAEHRGVHIVQQELNLIGTLSIAENIFLNRLPARMGFIGARRLLQAAEKALHDVGLDDVDPTEPVGHLGVGKQQLVEIASALSRDCRILILDEPTAALTGPQIEVLFRHVARLQAKGVGIIYISHRLEEIRRIAHRATILRDGRVVASEPLSTLDFNQIVRLMAGQDLEREWKHRGREPGPVALQVESMNRGRMVRDVSFSVRSNEIFGIAGLVGSGRTEVVRAIFGADRASSGALRIGPDGEPRRFLHPRDAVRAGVAMIPEDRKQHGLLLPKSIRMNVTLSCIHTLVKPRGWIDQAREVAETGRMCGLMDVQCHSQEQHAEHLSGGNQQKVIIGRWLMQNARVLLFDEPTRGIDVAAKAKIYHLLNDLADTGKAVVMVSSDLDELLEICDRIGVMSTGKMMAIFDRAEWSREKIMEAAVSG